MKGLSKFDFYGLGCFLGALKLDHFVEKLLTALCGNNVALAIPGTLLGNICLLSCDFTLLINIMLFGNLAVNFPLLHALSVVAVV